MNREIKFKGKRVDNGEWVHGFYVLRPDGKHLIYWKPFKEASQNTYHEVIPETVGQFTGLHDKNGNEVYEGDLLLNFGHFEHECIFQNSAFGYESFGFISFEANKNNLKIIEGKIMEIEIIGNIHDNTTISTS